MVSGFEPGPEAYRRGGLHTHHTHAHSVSSAKTFALVIGLLLLLDKLQPLVGLGLGYYALTYQRLQVGLQVLEALVLHFLPELVFSYSMACRQFLKSLALSPGVFYIVHADAQKVGFVLKTGCLILGHLFRGLVLAKAEHPVGGSK